MKSYPWDSLEVRIGEDGYPVYDRPYMASDLQGVQGRFFSNGIFVDEPNAYRQTPGDGMSVMVDVGWCCINGTFGYPDDEALGETRKMVLQAAGSKPRIDTVVIRWNANAEKRTIDLYVVAGAPSDVPVRPTLTRSDTVWELGICDVLIPAYTTEVKAERITDTRLENERCGVCSPFAPVSTTEFYDQLTAQTNEALELSQSLLDGSIVGQLSGRIDDVDDKADGKVSKSGDTMSGALSLGVPLGIASGGTGGSTTAKARENLEVPKLVTSGKHVLLAKPDGTIPDFLRTPTSGILPASSNSNGASSVGDSSWPFANGYFKNITINGTTMTKNAVVARALYFSASGSKTASDGTCTATATVTLSSNRTGYYPVIRSMYNCTASLNSDTVSGNTLTLTFILRNITNWETTPGVNGYILEFVNGVRQGT